MKKTGRLTSNSNFCNLENEYSGKDNARFLILPIPYEATTTYGRGTAFGPKAIIDASCSMETYDEELGQETYKHGIHTLPFFMPPSKDPEEMNAKLTNYMEQNILMSRKASGENRIISLGGEHSISPGLIKAFASHYKDLSVLYLDAHADLRNSYRGNSYNHACAARRILEYCPLVSCGIRSISSEEIDFIRKTNHPIYWEKDALEKYRSVADSLSGRIYISLDVDVLDPSIMLATGTPEPNGWNWQQLCGFLKYIISIKDVVGVDIVELAPVPGINAPDFTAAKLVYRIMGYIAQARHPSDHRKVMK